MRLQASRQASPGDHSACRNLSAEVWNGYRELRNCFARAWFRQRCQQMSQTKQTWFLLLTTDRCCRNLNVISLSVGCSCTSSWVAWWSWCCLGCTRSWRPERCVFFVFFHVFLRFLAFDSWNLLIWPEQRKRIPLKVEKGTGGMNDVDISWIPQETLNAMSTSAPSLSSRWDENEALRESDTDTSVLQTRLRLKHLQGNELTERPGQISESVSFHHCT